jgi:hypothetical protein
LEETEDRRESIEMNEPVIIERAKDLETVTAAGYFVVKM